MAALKNLSVKSKIFVFVGFFQILTFIIAILGTSGLSRMEKEVTSISDIYENLEIRLTRMKYHVTLRRNKVLQITHSPKKEELDELFKAIKESETTIENDLKGIQTYISSNQKIFKKNDLEKKLLEILDKINLNLKEFKETTDIYEKSTRELLDYKTRYYRKIELERRVSRAFEDKAKLDGIILKLAYDFSKHTSDAFQDGKQNIGITSASVKGVLWGGLGVCVLIAIILAIVMLRTIAIPIKEAETMANRFAEGDLTINIANDAGDEIGKLMRALNKAAKNLSTLIKNIGETADHLASSAEELSATSRNLADGATNQASSLEETASAITEISESISYVSQSARDQEKEVLETGKYMKELSRSIVEVSQTARSLSDGSNSVLSEAKDGQVKVDESVKRMGAIEESSEQISEIIVVINDIFTQTNLLSLNAAIEAARAGESGRGFAVVAEEISKLAARSQKATNEIDELIADSISKVNDGKSITGQIVESLVKILQKSKEAAGMSDNIASQTKIQTSSNEKVMKSVQTLSQMAEAISRATTEMDLSAKEIANAIEQVNIVAQNTASSSEEMAASTSELALQSEKLSELINAFKVN
ncbi:MAG: methyl-accepting chemotaxis protein [Leptospiraceae bacterium]|nr:methyl-accepting chemotaxis protein [Leptospiraceae bacterium]